MFDLSNLKVAVIGLGYVGLPLAVEFARRYPTVGFDISSRRVAELREGKDRSLEVDPAELKALPKLSFANDPAAMADCTFYVAAVPTPVDNSKQPDMTALRGASRSVGGVLKRGDVVVYESTVYPGATEEICVPILEAGSGLRCNRDFFVGYSPERINPGDKAHRLPSIVKVTSGSTPAAADFIDRVYASIVTAGTFRAESIRVAEAAKVIENTQRDVNIALVNELAMLFDRLGLDTGAVLAAAGSKWNFLPFQPGLVGGHCIGVDPYYLTHKAQQVGHHPEMILAGRRINDGMGAFVAAKVVKLLVMRGLPVKDARILILGITFKEDCPDLRNTRVADLVREFGEFGAHVDVLDPWADPHEAQEEYGIALLREAPERSYDAVVLAVAHKAFDAGQPENIRRYAKPNGIVYDVKRALPRGAADARL
jgi:UDP-N-acetyl-D-galactosamine dehydrogenase